MRHKLLLTEPNLNLKLKKNIFREKAVTIPTVI